jgi:hypothetical protein
MQTSSELKSILATLPSKEVVWKPLPGSQIFALDSRANETLYHGTRGPGKTEIQLMRFKRRVGVGYGSFWRGVIFDCEYKNLDDLVIKSKRLFAKFKDGAEWHSSTSSYKWTWPTGEELLFRAVQKQDDYNNYHGQEFPFIGWNELTKQKTSFLYDAMLSCNRSSFTEKDWPIVKGKAVQVPPIPIEVFSTTNSKGPGKGWVKLRFIDPAVNGKTIRVTRTIYNPATKQDEQFTRTQVAIFGSWRENPYLSKENIAHLMSIKDEATRRSWLLGDWNVVSGGAFSDIWRDNYHVLPRFKIPYSWYVDRTFDWGSSQPFCVGWYAEANGEEAVIVLDGKEYSFCPPKGTLVKLDEWYGTQEPGSNRGLRLSPGMIAKGILEREARLIKQGWIASKPHPGPADNQIRNVNDTDTETIEKRMSDAGIKWLTSDKSPGSRKQGFELATERLSAVTDPEKRYTDKGMYYMDNCRDSIRILPAIERDVDDEDDVSSEGEDHPWDENRYRILAGTNRSITSMNVQHAC